MLSGSEMFSRWSQRFAGALESDGLDSAADELEQIIEKDDEFIAWFEHAALHAWMAGQLFVRSVELEDEAINDAPGTVRLGAVRALAVDPNSFVNLPFQEAINFFTARDLVSIEEFNAVRGRFRKGAFAARRISSGVVADTARRAVGGVVAGNVRPAQAAALIRDGSLSLGIQPESNHYLMNVVRTNTATNYNAGRLAAQQSDAVKALRPFWRYVTANDERVRDEHAALNGQVFEADSPEGLEYYPPLGYQCRCVMTTMSERQLDASGLTVNTSGNVPGAAITEGFEEPPI